MSYDVEPADLELAVEPANPNLSREARDVLAYVQLLPGNGWLAGQEENDDSVDAEQTYIQDLTGKKPALRGFDVAEYIVDPIDEIIDTWHDHGQLVTVSWHICRPHTESDFENVLDFYFHEDAPEPDMDALAEKYGDHLGDELLLAEEAAANDDYYQGRADVEAALTDGTDQHEWLQDKLEWMADRLEPTKEADVPVIWRPYHEMDGGWFWWSNGGPEAYCQLWEQMYDYFVNERELNNLIWAWSRSHEPQEGWYPGDDYVDVTGVDTYRRDYPDLDWGEHYQRVLDVSDEKPVALAECDIVPDPDDVRDEYNFVWTLPWHGLIRENEEDHIQYVYDHEYTITAADLPDF